MSLFITFEGGEWQECPGESTIDWQTGDHHCVGAAGLIEFLCEYLDVMIPSCKQ